MGRAYVNARLPGTDAFASTAEPGAMFRDWHPHSRVIRCVDANIRAVMRPCLSRR